MSETKGTKAKAAATRRERPAAERWAEMIRGLEPARAQAVGQIQNRKYRYATLVEVMRVATEALQRHGFALLQGIAALEGGGHQVETRVVDAETGELMTEAVIHIPGGIGPQELGSWITYARRYSIGTCCGLVVEEDDDAASAQAAHEQRSGGGGRPAGARNGAAQEVRIPVGVHRVRPVTVREAKRTDRWTLWVITCEEGEAATFSETVADLCASAAKRGATVELTIEERKGRLHAARAALVEDGGDEGTGEQGPGADDDLPF